jgi:hypothetical protein
VTQHAAIVLEEGVLTVKYFKEVLAVKNGLTNLVELFFFTASSASKVAGFSKDQ